MLRLRSLARRYRGPKAMKENWMSAAVLFESVKVTILTAEMETLVMIAPAAAPEV